MEENKVEKVEEENYSANKQSLPAGVVGLLLMFLFSKMLVVKINSAGFFQGILFSWAYAQSVKGVSELSFVILMAFLVFIGSFFHNKKNRIIAFYSIICLTLVKWVVDIFGFYSLVGGDNFSIKLWAIFLFFVGSIIVYEHLIDAADK